MAGPGRSDELTAWVAATAQRALAYAVTLVRNRTEAEDVVHDCYVRLLARAGEYDLPRDGEKLLFKAITNACINLVQRRPPVVSLEAVEHAGGADRPPLADKPETRPDRRAMDRELEHAIENALMTLPVTQRAVVELHSLGYSLVEVAEMLDLSHSNARVVLHRARRALAAKLRRFVEDDVA
jgi:RNA polymerase sigma-70 factor (ECF subfamily)